MNQICITTKTLGIGGAEVLLKMIIPKLKKLGYTVHVVYFSIRDNELVSFLENCGVNVVYMGELRGVGILKTLISYYNFLKKNKFDIIFDNSPIPAFFSRVFKKNEKIVYLEHNTQEAYNVITRNLNKFTYNLNDEIICCSKDVFESNGRKGMIIDNAIDIDSIRSRVNEDSFRAKLGWPSDSKIIVNIANTSFRKNQKMLIKAFESIEDQNAHLLIVGLKLEAFQKLEEQIEKSPNKERIALYGPSDDIPTILSQSNIFTLTSFQEGLPIALLEAMAFGVVPVCTDVGGIGTVIDPACGYLVEVNDDKKLAMLFDLLLRDDKLCIELRESCKRKVESGYDIDSYIEKLDKAFSKVMAQGYSSHAV